MKAAVCFALACLAAPLARAQTVTCEEPSYLPRGDRWPTTVPFGQTGSVRPLPIEFRIASGGSDDVASTDAEQQAVARAATSWNEVSCAGGAPSVQLARGTDYPTADDGGSTRNIVFWVEEDWDLSSSTIAYTGNEVVDDTGYITNADMRFNGVDFRFHAESDTGQSYGCEVGTVGCFDVEVVALHELGHFFGFDHVQCADAVMFPNASPDTETIELSKHERTGLCSVYPPRPAEAGARALGELCASDAECGDGLVCVISGSGGANIGWCSIPCVSTAECPVAYVCASTMADRKFCRPGPNGTNASAPPGGSDMCVPCSASADCLGGVCANDGVGENICTRPCSVGSLETLCPVGMDCVGIDNGNLSICWPQPGNADCGNDDTRGQLNDVCYVEGASFAPCGPGLTCVLFRERPGMPQVGGCVAYCNDTTACPEANQTCCHGIDATGNCIDESTPDTRHGGCFDLRREGEQCVLAEQSVCRPGTQCVAFGTSASAAANARCYRACDDGSCPADETCLTFSAGDASFNYCCLHGTGLQGQPPCEPTQEVASLEVGVRCARNADCDSGLCLSYDGDSACVRTCDVSTQYGCPGDVDVNRDGVTDGGFSCRLIEGEGYCWPRLGPVDPPSAWQGDDVGDGGGCCNALNRPATVDDVWQTAALWLLAAGYLVWLRRRAGARA